MGEDIIAKIEQAGLIGRGGAGYPTAKKWQAVKKASGLEKYVICNASEGETGLFKDIHILKNYPEMVVQGLILALDYLGAKKGYFNINKNYHRLLRAKLEPIVQSWNDKGYDLKFYVEEPSYIGGEETALLNAIEGKRTEPRLKPPYPSDSGLFSQPTIINNVETLYNVALVDKGEYVGKRFYCLSGKIKKPGVYHLPADWSVEKVLKETGNYPAFKFFAQIGGGISGLVLNQEQLAAQQMTGAGSIEVHDLKTKPRELVTRWLKFYQQESCGKCTPCRVGTYELYELVKASREVPWDRLFEIVETTEATSFCALGQSVGTPLRSYYSNVLKNT